MSAVAKRKIPAARSAITRLRCLIVGAPCTLTVLVGVMLAGCASAGTSTAGAPKSPFVDVEARRALIGAPQGRFTCPATPVPVSDLPVDFFYSDIRSTASTIDPVRWAAREEAVKPLTRFLDAVTRSTDRWQIARPVQPEAARCALAILDVWASADAMLGRVTMQGGFERKWTLGGMALAYLRLRHAPDVDPAAAARIEAWMGRLGRAVKSEYDWPRSLVNNHLYWAALAAASTAIVTGDHALFDWAIATARFGLSQIESDGTLSLEISRGSKALHYHNFAVMPLVVVAEIAAANGIDLYGKPGGPLHRLVVRVVTDLDDPAYMVRLTGKMQDPAGGALGEPLSGWHIAWAEVWYARTGDPAVLPLLRRYRPMGNYWLGGDMTFALGVKDLPP